MGTLLLNGNTINEGQFSYPVREPTSFARVPLTLVAAADLAVGKNKITVQWFALRGSTLHTGGTATLVALI